MTAPSGSQQVAEPCAAIQLGCLLHLRCMTTLGSRSSVLSHTASYIHHCFALVSHIYLCNKHCPLTCRTGFGCTSAKIELLVSIGRRFQTCLKICKVCSVSRKKKNNNNRKTTPINKMKTPKVIFYIAFPKREEFLVLQVSTINIIFLPNFYLFSIVCTSVQLS